VSCVLLGAQVVPGVPVASDNAAALLYDSAVEVPAGLHDRQRFAAEVKADAFRHTPGSELLTGLHGKDVVISFVESYGRSAVEDPRFAPKIDPLLDDGSARLRAAGFASRSGWLTSPTAGGGSWLAQTTLLSGVWINNQQRYQDLVNSDRMNLNDAFHKADWRTVGVMPAINRVWPEGRYYGFDQQYTTRTNNAYRGPWFNFDSMPDQYTLSAFQRAERANPGHTPVLADIALLSSHTPWTPLPRLIPWSDVGDGSVYGPMARHGASPDAIWRDPGRVRDAYRNAVEYSLSCLISYVETYGDDNLVLVVLGDHQPTPLITGAGASRDVPISVIARDPAVLDRISGWGWQDGLRPGKDAPVWRMSAFRDKFLTAFGPQPGRAAAVPTAHRD
jgi:hypothetical protein